jgi:hypothetical protein
MYINKQIFTIKNSHIIQYIFAEANIYKITIIETIGSLYYASGASNRKRA